LRSGDAVRDQPPRPLPPRRRPARRPGCGRRSPHRRRELERPPALAGGLRRSQLLLPSIRRVGRLRPVQDGQHPLRRGRGPALGGRWHRRELADARLHPHGPAAAHRPGVVRARPRGAQGRHAGQVARAGGGHLGAAGGLPAPRRHLRPLLRGCERGRGRNRAGKHRRQGCRGLRAGPGQRRAPLGRIARARGEMTAPDLITTPFGFHSTAAEVIKDIDLSGKRAIVTGGSSGIGVETARALAGAGAEVTLAVRDTAAGERTATDIRARTGNDAVHVGRLELADLSSVAAFLASWSGPLDILVNNAGVMALPDLQLAPDGWEMQFATNHLGHFALALGLHDALTLAGDARVVSLSSRGHMRSPVIFDDINFSNRPYDPGLAYGQSKTANVLFAVEANRRWAGDAITVNAVHPGAISATNLSRHMDTDALAAVVASGTYRYKTIEQGAATSVLVAASPLLEGVGGRYFEDCNQAPVVEAEPEAAFGVATHAVDIEAAARLWQVSI